MYYVYILQSAVDKNKIYTGLSTDIKKRMQSHNSGANSYSKKFRPWKLIWFCGFANRNNAIAF